MQHIIAHYSAFTPSKRKLFRVCSVLFWRALFRLLVVQAEPYDAAWSHHLLFLLLVRVCAEGQDEEARGGCSWEDGNVSYAQLHFLFVVWTHSRPFPVLWRTNRCSRSSHRVPRSQQSFPVGKGKPLFRTDFR